jgi:hypothetical protein
MQAGATARVESGMDAVAAALFAAAIGYAVHAVLGSAGSVAAGGTLAFALCFAGLRKVAPEERRFDVPECVADASATPIGALLTEADRVMSEAKPDAHELTLDDVLAEIGPGSRVVRLFDANSMPTPGQLQARIDEHLDIRTSLDASQALLDALAELRRSLN